MTTLRKISTPLHSETAQRVMNENVNELPLFKRLMDKGKRKGSRRINLYYNSDNQFVGYLIYKPKSDNYVNLNDVEILSSIRLDKNQPRYGQPIINQFITDSKTEFAGITLQADTEPLIGYYERYGFKLDASTGSERWMRLTF